MKASVKITGLAELQKTFSNMPRATRNKVSRPAMRRGAAIIRDAAQVNVAAITDKGYSKGLLKRSLRVYTLKMYRGMIRVGVFVKRGLHTSKGVRVGTYAAVLEYGKKGQPPRSFLRKATRENAAKAGNIISEEIRKRIPEALAEAKR